MTRNNVLIKGQTICMSLAARNYYVKVLWHCITMSQYWYFHLFLIGDHVTVKKLKQHHTKSAISICVAPDNFVTPFLLQKLSCWRYNGSVTRETAKFLFSCIWNSNMSLKHGNKIFYFKLTKIRKLTQNMPQNSQEKQTKSYAHKYTHIHIQILAKND